MPTHNEEIKDLEEMDEYLSEINEKEHNDIYKCLQILKNAMNRAGLLTKDENESLDDSEVKQTTPEGKIKDEGF